MGATSSKSSTAPTAAGAGGDQRLTLSQETVQLMCQEAYAAGAEDAGNRYMLEIESTRRQDFAMGGLACLVSFWLAYVYGSVQVAREKAFGMEHMEAQKELLVVAAEDLRRAQAQASELSASLQLRDELIGRQRSELARAAKLRRAMTVRMRRLAKQATVSRQEMASMRGALAMVNTSLYAGAAAVTVLWLGTVLWVVRRGPRRVVPAPNEAQ